MGTHMLLLAMEYTHAAICRRGHLESLDMSVWAPSPRCTTCGAVVLQSCPQCQARIRGLRRGSGAVLPHWEAPPFCDNCGSPFPWAGREARIYQLQNLLDEEELDPADDLVVREQLQSLLNADLDEKEQVKRWKRIASKAPGFLDKAASQPIVQSLASTAVKVALDWPPGP